VLSRDTVSRETAWLPELEPELTQNGLLPTLSPVGSLDV